MCDPAAGKSKPIPWLYCILEEMALLVQNRVCFYFDRSHCLLTVKKKNVVLCVFLRCVYVGDPHARGKALPGSEEQ